MHLTLIYAARFYQDAGRILVQPAYGMYVEALARHADEVVLCGPVSDRPVAGSGFELRSDNIRVVPLPYYERDAEGVRRLPGSLSGLWQALDGASLASIMLPLGALGPVAFAVARLRRVPVFLHVVGDLGEQWSPSAYHGAVRWVATRTVELLEWVQQGMIRRAPTFAQGRALLEKHRRPGVRISMAMETTIQHDDVLPEGRTRRPGREARLLYAGNLIPPKGVHVLLDALAALRVDEIDWRLSVAGTGPQLDALRDQALRLGFPDRVDFVGFQTLQGVMSLMDEADLFVFPSFGEGMPRVLLESLARGLPVVASDVGGISGVVTHGVNGWLVPAGDPSALAGAIRRAVTDDQAWEQASSNGLETARQHTMEHYAQLMVRELSDAGLWRA